VVERLSGRIFEATARGQMPEVNDLLTEEEIGAAAASISFGEKRFSCTDPDCSLFASSDVEEAHLYCEAAQCLSTNRDP